MKKRWALLLALAFCLTLIVPGKVQAVATSGSCGESATWSFDEATGTLTIAGTGKMDYGEYEPWSDLDEAIKRVVIGNGITNIPHGSFSNLRELTEVVIPESVVTIEGSAFRGCKNLKSIDLHDGILELGSECFEGTGLTEVTIPKGVTVLPFAAFRRCGNLTEVNLHNGITEIGLYAFYNCYYLEEIIIPDNVTVIKANAFTNCTRLTNVVLSKNLKIIEGGLFRDCSSLKEIEIPDSVIAIENNAFTNTALEKVMLGAGVASIASTAFDQCPDLKAFIVSDFNSHFSVDSSDVLYNKDKTELFFAPEGLTGAYTVHEGTEIIRTGAFRDCVNLTEITLPDSIQEFGNYAFYNCKNLKEMKLPSSLQTIGEFALSNCDSLLELVIPASVTKVKCGFVGYCDKMEYLIFVGQPPEFDELALNGFSKILYYPSYHAAWMSVSQLLAVKATWVSYDCTDHNVVTTPSQKPTCTEDGSTEGTHCELCGVVLTAPQSIPAAGHSFGSWKRVQEPTVEKTGLEQRTCNNCGEVESKVLDKLQGPADQPTNPTDAPTDPVDTPTEPTQTPTDLPSEPTQPSGETTEPMQEGTQPVQPSVTTTDPTQPEITVTEEPKTFPWVIVVIAVAAIGAAATGVILGKKRK